jgi:hypothetical protein
MGRGGTGQLWPNARVAGGPELRRLWGSTGAGERIGERNPDKWASGGGDCGARGNGPASHAGLGWGAAVAGRRGEK